MKYNDKYPNVKKDLTTLGPHKEVWVETGLCQTWMVGRCEHCKSLTGWTDYTLEIGWIKVCSEECRASALATSEEAEKTHAAKEDEKAEVAVPEAAKITGQIDGKPIPDFGS